MAISDKRENSDNGLVSKIGIKNKVYEIKDLIAREEVEKILTNLEEFDMSQYVTTEQLENLVGEEPVSTQISNALTTALTWVNF